MATVAFRPRAGDDGSHHVRLVDSAALTQTFRDLHDRYHADLRQFVRRRVRDRDLADDITQETFLRAFLAHGAFDATRPAWPWLATIARNLLVNKVRDEQRYRKHVVSGMAWDDLEDHTEGRVEYDPERRFIARQRHETISSALMSLPPRQQRVLLMRAMEGLGCQEIASIEGVSVDAVKSLIKRARRSFKVAYERAAALRGDAALLPIGSSIGVSSGAGRRAPRSSIGSVRRRAPVDPTSRVQLSS